MDCTVLGASKLTFIGQDRRYYQSYMLKVVVIMANIGDSNHEITNYCIKPNAGSRVCCKFGPPTNI